jgi:hypothetical protein
MAACLILIAAPTFGVDLAKIARTIAKEPKYQSKPKYCLLVFGPEAKTRVWLVLDPDARLLYVDRNGNGDLTEKGERVKPYEANVDIRSYRAGDVAGPDGKPKYTNLSVVHWATERGADGPSIAPEGFDISVEVKGKGKAQSAHVKSFADKPQDAPVIHFDGVRRQETITNCTFSERSMMKATAILLGFFAVFAVSESARGDPNPGLKAVADSSTDIAVLEVVDSKPHKAIEGARDTAQFKVVRTLKGPLQPGDKIGVYYHLLWADTEKWVLEKPKFERGNRYTVFLVKGQEYTLTDQWLAVLPEHPDLDKDVAHALNEVGDLWSDYWRKQHKGPLASRRRIEILPDAKVRRTKDGLTLSVAVVNHSAQEITTHFAHEWHAGEWPSTDLYASATPVQTKQAKPLVPVFLKGKDQSEAKLVRIAPGKSITIELRMDWPGIGSQPTKPLLSPSESETNVRILMVFDAGGTAREYAASAVKYVRIVDE